MEIGIRGAQAGGISVILIVFIILRCDFYQLCAFERDFFHSIPVSVNTLIRTGSENKQKPMGAPEKRKKMTGSNSSPP